MSKRSSAGFAVDPSVDKDVQLDLCRAVVHVIAHLNREAENLNWALKHRN